MLKVKLGDDPLVYLLFNGSGSFHSTLCVDTFSFTMTSSNKSNVKTVATSNSKLLCSAN